MDTLYLRCTSHRLLKISICPFHAWAFFSLFFYPAWFFFCFHYYYNFVLRSDMCICVGECSLFQHLDTIFISVTLNWSLFLFYYSKHGKCRMENDIVWQFSSECSCELWMTKSIVYFKIIQTFKLVVQHSMYIVQCMIAQNFKLMGKIAHNETDDGSQMTNDKNFSIQLTQSVASYKQQTISRSKPNSVLVSLYVCNKVSALWTCY